jgi:hypothetical protein
MDFYQTQEPSLINIGQLLSLNASEGSLYLQNFFFFTETEQDVPH